MPKIVKNTENTHTVYSGENREVQTTSITFSILDDADNQVGDGAVNSMPGMPGQTKSISMTLNLRTTLDPAAIFAKLPNLLHEEGGAE